MQPARQAGDEAKVLSKAAIEEVLEAHIRARGEEGLNALRDEARAVAQTLGFEAGFKKLNAIISALLSTRPAKLLSSPPGLARALGEPCDTDRLELFNTLFVALQQAAFPDYPDKNTTPEAFAAYIKIPFGNDKDWESPLPFCFNDRLYSYQSSISAL